MANRKTKHFIMNNGERYKLLTDFKTGIPLYYPTLYITSQVRGSGHSVSTIQSFISSMKVLLKWEEYYSIGLEGRFKRKNFLSLREIESLRNFCKKPMKENEYKKSNVIVLKKTVEGSRMPEFKTPPMVLSHTQYSRMTFIADYLKWLAEIISENKLTETDRRLAKEMYNRLKAHRPKKRNGHNGNRDEKSLDPEMLEELFEVLKPGHIKNPFQNLDIQIRNALIITLLRFLGIRRGELLNLQVEDIDCFANELWIVRRADSTIDQRPFQPLVKTLERNLPMNEQLAEKLRYYIMNVRSKFPRARKHPYFFVTHKVGPNQGLPLSNSGFGKIITKIQKISDSFKNVHAHSFRHTWNYFFSINCDSSKEEVTPARQEQIRSFLMGWKEGSGTAAIYNKRFIKRAANKAALEYQTSLYEKANDIDEKK